MVKTEDEEIFTPLNMIVKKLDGKSPFIEEVIEKNSEVTLSKDKSIDNVKTKDDKKLSLLASNEINQNTTRPPQNQISTELSDKKQKDTRTKSSSIPRAEIEQKTNQNSFKTNDNAKPTKRDEDKYEANTKSNISKHPQETLIESQKSLHNKKSKEKNQKDSEKTFFKSPQSLKQESPKSSQDNLKKTEEVSSKNASQTNSETGNSIETKQKDKELIPNVRSSKWQSNSTANSNCRKNGNQEIKRSTLDMLIEEETRKDNLRKEAANEKAEVQESFICAEKFQQMYKK